MVEVLFKHDNVNVVYGLGQHHLVWNKILKNNFNS